MADGYHFVIIVDQYFPLSNTFYILSRYVLSMHKKILQFILISIIFTFNVSANIVAGGVFDKLKVTSTYTTTTSLSPYISFNENSMPGCYGNKGGYLILSDPAAKELYSQILILMTTGGIKGKVLYQKVGDAANWSACHIKGLYLFP